MGIKLKKTLSFLLIFLVFASGCFAQSHWIWGKGSSSNRSSGLAAATDHNNHIITSGWFSDSLLYDSLSVYDPGIHGFIIKTDPDGSGIWLDSVGGYNSSVIDVDADAGNNIIAGGSWSDSLRWGTFSFYAPPDNYLDPFVAKLNPSGDPLWIRTAYGSSAGGTSTGIDEAVTVTCDNQSNVFAAYSFASPMLIIDADTFYNPGAEGYVLAKYDPAGNTLWKKTASCNSNHITPTAIRTDNDGNVYVTGYYSGTMVIFDTDTLTSTNYISWNMFVVKYDPLGNVVLARSFYYGTSDVVEGWGINVDVHQNIYLTGLFFYNAQFDSFHLINPGNGAFFVKLDSAGISQWAHAVGGWNYTIGYDVEITEEDNVYFFFGSQSFLQWSLTIGPDYYPADTTSTDPAFIVKYDSNGNFICSGSLRSGGFNSSSSYHSLTSFRTSDEVFLFGNGSPGTPIYLWNDTIVCDGLISSPYLASFSCGFSAGTSGITEEVIKFRVYPNPAGEYITVELYSSEKENSFIEIRNVLGQTIASDGAQINAGQTKKEMDVSELPAGIYFITLQNGNGMKSLKFIKP